MLAIEKSKDLIEQIGRILRRMSHIKEVRAQQSDFLTELQELYSSYAQRIHKEMVLFEEAVIKHTLYSSAKANPVVNFAKLFRDFAQQVERTARLNLLSLQRIRAEELTVQETRLTRKCELFVKEFQGYLGAEKAYNVHYNTYSDKCALLDQTIRRYTPPHVGTPRPTQVPLLPGPARLLQPHPHQRIHRRTRSPLQRLHQL